MFPSSPALRPIPSTRQFEAALTIKHLVMKHSFNIYPALFILTPVQVNDAIPPNSHEGNDETAWTCEAERYFTSCPQTYWGNCIFNASHTQLILSFNNKEMNDCPVLDLVPGTHKILQPAKFRGKHYTITYIPAEN